MTVPRARGITPWGRGGVVSMYATNSPVGADQLELIRDVHPPTTGSVSWPVSPLRLLLVWSHEVPFLISGTFAGRMELLGIVPRPACRLSCPIAQPTVATHTLSASLPLVRHPQNPRTGTDLQFAGASPFV
jgi:hypothetical protein